MYVAIIALQETNRACVEAHLLRLSPQDRSLRFAAGLVTDETIRRYVTGIRFDSDVVVGLVSKLGHVVGMAHGCVFEARGTPHVEAAFSVDAPWRGRGFGGRLMDAVVLRTRAAGGGALVGTCAARNLPMRRIFERADMSLTREDDEWSARRVIPPTSALAAA